MARDPGECPLLIHDVRRLGEAPRFPDAQIAANHGAGGGAPIMAANIPYVRTTTLDTRPQRPSTAPKEDSQAEPSLYCAWLSNGEHELSMLLPESSPYPQSSLSVRPATAPRPPNPCHPLTTRRTRSPRTPVVAHTRPTSAREVPPKYLQTRRQAHLSSVPPLVLKGLPDPQHPNSVALGTPVLVVLWRHASRCRAFLVSPPPV